MPGTALLLFRPRGRKGGEILKHLGTKQDLKIVAGQVLSLPCRPEEGAQLAEDSSAFAGRACAVGSFYYPYPGAALVRKDVLKAVPLCRSSGKCAEGESDGRKGSQE